MRVRGAMGASSEATDADASADALERASLVPESASGGGAHAHAHARDAPAPAPLGSYLAQVGPALGTWLSFSIGLILFNKYLYMHAFKHPITLTAVHMVFMTAVTQALAAAGRLPVPRLGWAFYGRWILPIAGLFAIALASSNVAAQRLPVSFIQMIKAVTPLMTLAVCVVAGTERFAWALVAITATMTFGVGVASLGELGFDALGFALQVVALTAESVRVVVIQRVVQVHLPRPTNPLVSLALFAPPCAAILVPAAAMLEPGAWATLALPSVGPVVLANAIAALGLNFAVVWMVSHESGPLTLTLAGILKDVALIVSSVFLFGNAITPIQVGGCVAPFASTWRCAAQLHACAPARAPRFHGVR
jgi:hypothetical protein